MPIAQCIADLIYPSREQIQGRVLLPIKGEWKSAPPATRRCCHQDPLGPPLGSPFQDPFMTEEEGAAAEGASGSSAFTPLHTIRSNFKVYLYLLPPLIKRAFCSKSRTASSSSEERTCLFFQQRKVFLNSTLLFQFGKMIHGRQVDIYMGCELTARGGLFFKSDKLKEQRKRWKRNLMN